MQSISEIVSPWRGSSATEESVREQVRERYGDTEANAFSATHDAMPHASWASYGYRVKRGEKAFRSVTIVEMKNGKGEVQTRIPRTVFLFHRRQVEKTV